MEHDCQHPLLARLQLWLAEGSLKRRDFLRLATLLGVAAPLAYRMIGVPTESAMAATAHASALSGGRLTLGMRIQEVESPHALSWLPPANLLWPAVAPPVQHAGRTAR